MTMSRILRLTAATALLAGPLVASVPGTSYAAGETCDGKPATIVISAEPDPEEFGTPGDDVVAITTPDVFTFDALAGDDTVCAGAGTTMVLGGDGKDTIDLTALAQNGRVDAGAGNDTVVGSAHDDFLFGGDGNDTISAGRGDDDAEGGSGDDLVMGGAGDDSLWGGTDGGGAEPGTDVVQGGGGDDVVFDTASDETLVGGAGRDLLTLRQDVDDSPEVCDGDVPTAPPVLSVPLGTVTGLGNDAFSGFESYEGGPFRDTLIGGPGPDVLRDHYCGTARLLGEGGDDTLVSNSCGASVAGGPGDDSVTFDTDGTGRYHGGTGEDRMVFTQGNEYSCGSTGESDRRVDGGPGSNWLVLSAPVMRSVHRVDLQRGVVYTGSQPWAHLDRVQNVRQRSDPALNGSHLRMGGTAGPNILIGGPGPTTIFGHEGNDVLRGGPGHDVIYGGKGHDRCRAEVRHECEAR
jgi:Ca2+-binding RTX toxin-like protein